MDMRKKYPWYLWQDGAEHTTNPEEYSTTPQTLQLALRARARRDSVYVWTTTRMQQGKLHVTFRFADTLEDYNRYRKTRAADRDIKGRFNQQDEPAPAALCTFAGCGSPVRPEWPDQQCYERGGTPDAPGHYKSASGSWLKPKHT